MHKILFVCMGNICRSPMAQGVLSKLADRDGLTANLQLDSAGTHTTHRGETPDPRAVRVAASRGYDISTFRARSVRTSDFDLFDQVFAMDQDNLTALLKICPSHHQSKVSLYLPYVGITSPEEIPDPYYGSTAGFERVLDLCEEAGRRLIQRL